MIPGLPYPINTLAEEAQRAADARHWGLYRNAFLDLARVHARHREWRAALEHALWVLYVDAAGWVGETEVFPGVLRLVEKCASEAGVSRRALRAEFIRVAESRMGAADAPPAGEVWGRVVREW